MMRLYQLIMWQLYHLDFSSNCDTISFFWRDMCDILSVVGAVAKAQVLGDLPTFTLRCRAHCWTFRRSRNRRQGQFLHENYWIVMDDGRLELKFQPVSFFALCFTSRFLPVLCMKIPVSPRPSEGTRVLAPCGFPLDDALAELQKEKQNLVKMLLELRFLEEMTVVVVFFGRNPTWGDSDCACNVWTDVNEILVSGSWFILDI